VTALALHLGGALAIDYMSADDSDDEGLGLNGAEYAVELASPKGPESDLPPAPEDSQASQAAPDQPEQKVEVKDAPEERPQEVEEPDRTIDNPKPAAVDTPASEASPNAIDAARQTLDEHVPEADKPRAPNPGLGKDTLMLTADWNKKISAYVRLHQRYPEGRNEDKTVSVKLSLVLNRRGNVLSVNVAQSSGDAAFDDAAVSMVRRCDPFPPPPAALTDETFLRNLEVNFTPPKMASKSHHHKR
jgi:TonB family protein